MRKLAMEELNRVSIEEFKRQKKMPVIIILDNVRSLLNVGSIFRTADAFSLEAIFLCGITGKPPHREIEKTALGATQSVRWQYCESVETAMDIIQKEGYQPIAIEQAQGSRSLRQFYPQKGTKYALIFGNEVHGVSQVCMDQVSRCIEIPQFGSKHSFNIVVSVGIVLWDLFTKLTDK